MNPTPIDEVMQNLEAGVLRLVLTRITLRGRIRIEQDLKELEELVGGEIPEIRRQLDELFETTVLQSAFKPLTPRPAFPSTVPGEPGERKGPGRHKKPRPDAGLSNGAQH